MLLRDLNHSVNQKIAQVLEPCLRDHGTPKEKKNEKANVSFLTAFLTDLGAGCMMTRWVGHRCSERPAAFLSLAEAKHLFQVSLR